MKRVRQHIWHKCNDETCFICKGELDLCIVCDQTEGQIIDYNECSGGKSITEFKTEEEWLNYHRKQRRKIYNNLTVHKSYHPIFETKTGIGAGCGAGNIEHIESKLKDRDNRLIDRDISQWIKIVTTEYVKVR